MLLFSVNLSPILHYALVDLYEGRRMILKKRVMDYNLEYNDVSQVRYMLNIELIYEYFVV